MLVQHILLWRQPYHYPARYSGDTSCHGQTAPNALHAVTQLLENQSKYIVNILWGKLFDCSTYQLLLGQCYVRIIVEQIQFLVNRIGAYSKDYCGYIDHCDDEPTERD